MGLFKKSLIKFDGTREVETKIKNQTDNVISRRYKILIIITILVGIFLLIRLFITQIKQQDYYTAKLEQYSSDIYQSETFRGTIYDRNDQRLVYNKNVNCATYYAVKGIKEEEIETIANFLVKNVNIEIESVTLREKKDYLILKEKKYVKSLLTSEELKENNTTGIYALQLERITEDIINEKLTNEDIKFYKVFYAMKNCTSGSSVILEGLSIQEASLIGENSSLLRGIKVTNDYQREYTYDSFKSVLGKVTTKRQGLPATTKEILLAQDYNNDSRVGTSGIEQQYESILSGTSATYSISYDSKGNPIVTPVSSGTKGQDIRLTIDWEIQEALDAEIEKELKSHTGYNERYNNHIYVILMDPNNGDIIAMSGKQRDPETGEISDYAVGNYLNAYEIGSTFKGATIYMGFKNNVITKDTYFKDETWHIKGTPDKKSWSSSLGTLNEVQALAQSSNVYMFNVAVRLGKGNYVPYQALSLDTNAFDVVRKCAGELGLGVKTGLDVPTEALGYRGTSRQAGNLLDFVIGQYDTYTPIQMAQYVSTIASSGKRVQPHLFLNSFAVNDEGEKRTQIEHKVNILDDVSNYTLAFERVRTGFREGAVTGLAKSVNGYYQAAGKTGTAQVFDAGSNISIPNHAFVGYAPYDNPQISVACMAERQTNSESCKPLSKFALTKYFDKYGVKSE